MRQEPSYIVEFNYHIPHVSDKEACFSIPLLITKNPDTAIQLCTSFNIMTWLYSGKLDFYKKHHEKTWWWLTIKQTYFDLHTKNILTYYDNYGRLIENEPINGYNLNDQSTMQKFNLPLDFPNGC